MNRRAVAAVTAGAALVAATVWAVSSARPQTRVERPPNSATQAPLTATVTSQVIAQQHVFTGTLKAAVEARPLRSDGVVTAMPLGHGGTPRAGKVLMEVNGRPLIGLDLAFPLWRDLTAGSEGKDVKAVQSALQALGHYHGPLNGSYSVATQDAVRELYRQVRYPAPGVLPEGTGGSPENAKGNTAGSPEDVTTGTAADAALKASARRAGPASGAPVPLLKSEVVALGGGPWRLDLDGAGEGTILGGEITPTLTGAGASLTVEDGGTLVETLSRAKARELTIVGGNGSRSTTALVVTASVGEGTSVVRVRPTAGALEPGTVSGSVVVNRTAGPVLCVPVTALRPAPDGRTLVRLVSRQGVVEVPVTLGARGDRLVEVRGDGIVAGAKVELP